MPDPTQLDEQGNPVYESLDDNGNPISMSSPGGMAVTPSEQAQAIGKGVEAVSQSLPVRLFKGALNFLGTPAIPEPSDKYVEEHPILGRAKEGASFFSTPMTLGPLGILGGGFAINKGSKLLKSKAAAKFGEEVAAGTKEGDFLSEASIKPPMFNPKNTTGMTGSLQNPVKAPYGNKVILKQTTPETVASLRAKGYVPGGVTEDGKPFMIFSDKEPPGVVKIPKEKEVPTESKIRQWYNLPRGLMSVDLPYTTSAAFRQALPLVGTKNWFKSWDAARRAYGSAAAAEEIQQGIRNNPLFKPVEDVAFRGGQWVKVERPSFAEKFGVRMSELKNPTQREEQIRGQIAEKIPIYGRHVAGSNRAFGAFLDQLRANTLTDIVDTARSMGMDPTKAGNEQLAQQIANFINDATGRGTMKIEIPYANLKGFQKKQVADLEHSAKILTDVFFAPRMMASRINMMNPATYVGLDPLVRRQYIESMARAVGTWWTIASMAELSGAGEVNKDPNNADFGKIKIGNTRLDPGGGFQQYLVYFNRMKPAYIGTENTNIPLSIDFPTTKIPPIDLGASFLKHPGGRYVSSQSNKEYEFGEGYKPETRRTVSTNFLANKLHPFAKLAYDIWDADEHKNVALGDRTLQLFVPMLTNDLLEVWRSNPYLLPLTIPFSGLGGASQTYEGDINAPVITPTIDDMFGTKLERNDIYYPKRGR